MPSRSGSRGTPPPYRCVSEGVRSTREFPRSHVIPCLSSGRKTSSQDMAIDSGRGPQPTSPIRRDIRSRRPTPFVGTSTKPVGRTSCPVAKLPRAMRGIRISNCTPTQSSVSTRVGSGPPPNSNRHGHLFPLAETLIREIFLDRRAADADTTASSVWVGPSVSGPMVLRLDQSGFRPP